MSISAYLTILFTFLSVIAYISYQLLLKKEGLNNKVINELRNVDYYNEDLQELRKKKDNFKSYDKDENIQERFNIELFFLRRGLISFPFRSEVKRIVDKSIQHTGFFKSSENVHVFLSVLEKELSVSFNIKKWKKWEDVFFINQINRFILLVFGFAYLFLLFFVTLLSPVLIPYLKTHISYGHTFIDNGFALFTGFTLLFIINFIYTKLDAIETGIFNPLLYQKEALDYNKDLQQFLKTTSKYYGIIVPNELFTILKEIEGKELVNVNEEKINEHMANIINTIYYFALSEESDTSILERFIKEKTISLSNLMKMADNIIESELIENKVLYELKKDGYKDKLYEYLNRN